MQDFENRLTVFLKSLGSHRLAIVYSDRFEGESCQTWYHRWRTDVVSFFSQAAESLGMEMTFLNVDQLIEMSQLGRDYFPEYVLNLNAGNRYIGNLVIAPALSSWRHKTIAFCDARTSILSEDKPTSRLYAKEAGFALPRSFPDLKINDSAIYKPTNLGSSVGVYKKKYDGHEPDGYMVEEFIKGYDGTIVLIPSCTNGRLHTIAAQLVIPKVEQPTDWIYSEVAKEETREAPEMEFVDVDFDDEIADAASRLAYSCGCTSVARIDIRYTELHEGTNRLTLANTKFIELNALPTMGRKNNVIKYTSEYIAKNIENTAINFILEQSRDERLAAAMYLLGSSLYLNQFQTK